MTDITLLFFSKQPAYSNSFMISLFSPSVYTLHISSPSPRQLLGYGRQSFFFILLDRNLSRSLLSLKEKIPIVLGLAYRTKSLKSILVASPFKFVAISGFENSSHDTSRRMSAPDFCVIALGVVAPSTSVWSRTSRPSIPNLYSIVRIKSASPHLSGIRTTILGRLVLLRAVFSLAVGDEVVFTGSYSI